LTEINHRLTKEKKRLLNIVNTHLEDAFEQVRKDFRSSEMEHMQSLHVGIEVMLKEKTLLESIPTWPWAPSTLRGFIAAVLSPLFLKLAQQVLGRFFGL
jgi:hypothetical protein